MKQKENKKLNLNIWVLILEIVISLAVVFFLTIFLQSSLGTLDLKFGFEFLENHTNLFIISMSVLLVLLLWLVSLFGSFIAGGVIFASAISGLGIATALKMKYRQETVFPEDLKMINQLGLFQEIIGKNIIIIILVIVVLLIALGIYFLIRSFKLSKKVQIVRVISLAGLSLVMFFLWNFNTINSPIKKVIENQVNGWVLWDQTLNYVDRGYVPGFLFNLKSKPMEKPKNYSKSTVEEIVKKYQQKADILNENSNSEKPNIIFIMNESFSDMTKLKGIEINEDPIKEYKSIAENTYSGYMISPQYGGGTANVEFEALTSFSMDMLNPQISVPYSSLIPKYNTFPSVVSYLNNQGYYSTAIHPYNTTMYKRKDVYKTFEFDKFLSADNTNFSDLRKDSMYYSDKGAYDKTFEILKEKNTPQFVHLVTMQNHSPYTQAFSDKVYSVNNQENSELANYAQAMHESSVAIQGFLEELKQLDRRTIVVFWGDHLPPLYSEEVLNDNEDIIQFETPFMIYDSEHKIASNPEQLISPTYFSESIFKLTNLKTSGFYELVSDLQDNLISYKRGNYYFDGKWHTSIDNSNSELKQVYSDLQIIQYDIFSGHNYSLDVGFFD